MSIRFTAASPADMHEKLHGWVGEIDRASTRALAADAPITLGDAYEVKYLSAEAIASGRLLDAVQGSRRRQPILRGAQIQGDLELDDVDQPIAFHEGPAKDGLQAAVRAAQTLAGDFEACVIESAPLRFIGLWLHASGEDWIIPFAPNLTALTNYVPIRVADALAVLQPMAEAAVGASADPEAAGG